MTAKREAPATPECDRVDARADDLATVREFLDFAANMHIVLRQERDDECDGLAPNAVEALLMEWIGVDTAAREREFRAILAHYRATEHDNDDEE
jgi:hypothetical protein